MGLGKHPRKSIAAARSDATAARERLAGGVDPIEDRKRLQITAEAQGEVEVITFKVAAYQIFENLNREGRTPSTATNGSQHSKHMFSQR